MGKLSIKEKATNFDTYTHIQQVQKAVNKLSMLAIERGRVHDRSKLETPEVEYFTKYTDTLTGLTYNSPEYKACLEEMKPALDHHYAHNRHHPQHFSNGVEGMSIVDILEMVADWFSSAKRQNNGNLQVSLEESCKRFGIEPQLASIIKNTLEILEDGIE